MGRTNRWRRWSTLVLITGLIAASAACSSDETPPPVDPAAVLKANYISYANAIAAKDGAKAADLITSSSLSYYDGVRTSALDADEAALAKESLIDQLTVLTMRASLDATTLRSADARELVKVSVEKGLISNGSTPQEDLKDIKITADRASAQLVLAGAEDGQGQYPVRFVREGGIWKFDVTSLLEPAEAAMDQAAAAQKMGERTLIDTVIRTRFGKEKAAGLYEPIGRA